jgi:phage-related protein (TIGR01555 family)
VDAPETLVGPKIEEQAATDAYFVSAGGLGTRADRTRDVSIRAGCLDDSEVADLMENDGLFATLLARVVADALRGGFRVKPRADSEDQDDPNERVSQWAIEQEIEATWRQAFVQRNGFGGSVLLEMTSDRDQSRPRLGEPTGQRFMALAPNEIQGLEYNITNPFSPNYQRPARWTLSGYSIDPSWLKVLTTPRLYSTNLGVRRGGVYNHTWTGPSKARQFIEEVKRWGMSLQAATSALQTMSQMVLQSDAFMATGVKDPTMQSTIYWARVQDLANRRSSLQPIGIGKDETVSLLATSISGISELLDRLMVAVAAAAEMPVTVAFGVSPGGFGTGASEQRLWAARVDEFRRLELTPVIQWTLERAFGDEARGWQICYEPIDSPTALEDAELRLKQATIDQIYIDKQVTTPNEVALSRFTGDYSTHTQIDVELRIEPLDLGEAEEPEAPESMASTTEPEVEEPEAE